MLKVVYTTNDKKKNSKPVNVIKSGLNDLKNEIEGMGEEEEEIEKPNEIIDIAEKILKFNKQNQSGQGLKILTPDQFASKFGDKYGKELRDTATKTGIHAAKTASKRVVQRTAEATGDLIRNKIADKITTLGKTKSKEKEKKRDKKFTYHQKKDGKLLMT